MRGAVLIWKGLRVVLLILMRQHPGFQVISFLALHHLLACITCLGQCFQCGSAQASDKTPGASQPAQDRGEHNRQQGPGRGCEGVVFIAAELRAVQLVAIHNLDAPRDGQPPLLSGAHFWVPDITSVILHCMYGMC